MVCRCSFGSFMLPIHQNRVLFRSWLIPYNYFYVLKTNAKTIKLQIRNTKRKEGLQIWTCNFEFPGIRRHHQTRNFRYPAIGRHRRRRILTCNLGSLKAVAPEGSDLKLTWNHRQFWSVNSSHFGPEVGIAVLSKIFELNLLIISCPKMTGSMVGSRSEPGKIKRGLP